MATITKVTRITGWCHRESVEALGAIVGMVEDPVTYTVLSGRSAVIRSWFDEVTGSGYEVAEITLHDFEV